MIVHSYVKKPEGTVLIYPDPYPAMLCQVWTDVLPLLHLVAFSLTINPFFGVADHSSHGETRRAMGGHVLRLQRIEAKTSAVKKKRETIALVKDGVLMTHTIDQNRY